MSRGNETRSIGRNEQENHQFDRMPSSVRKHTTLRTTLSCISIGWGGKCMGFARPAVVVLAVVLTFGMLVSTSSQPSGPEPNLAIERGMAVVTGQATRKPHERLISGGVLASVRRAREAQTGGSLGRDTAPSVGNNATITTGGCSNVFPGTYNNVRVNQDCSFSLQGEEFIVVD